MNCCTCSMRWKEGMCQKQWSATWMRRGHRSKRDENTWSGCWGRCGRRRTEKDLAENLHLQWTSFKVQLILGGRLSLCICMEMGMAFAILRLNNAFWVSSFILLFNIIIHHPSHPHPFHSFLLSIYKNKLLNIYCYQTIYYICLRVCCCLSFNCVFVWLTLYVVLDWATFNRMELKITVEIPKIGWTYIYAQFHSQKPQKSESDHFPRIHPCRHEHKHLYLFFSKFKLNLVFMYI